ncbi:MAG: hemolysin secretion protein D [Sulfurimonas sp. RIFCSPLOWO2_12_FULL_36_74]|uniref:HlyD family type I secretion periplasmic adaptor subunit n=1 Tax=Sulfurimonas sp. RIFCSPLOWO2_12_36_12 TaxID=1802253 RepID=UPI0008B1FF4E|nr:HlyD family type I secretion periplasmic adaptor subunit [Sulfurimonas sp. RIFCSPLOWO2_12_36_12]OHD98593.1 MAG: hemolysin secretion protein D [Sulfurimonas sp. RIFCSPLOWO2_02_FULL_36_28]OHE02612.1 MAG: hemolysin secretion protein D [Sulfurimonas sp. RIFCSPLOWO2_12_36_12]OHE06339.1 MAG: hemolysin secretion protein D [Sulfurimonas sp. RIFCSPLOWO2_12_FULL_36_74]
MSLEDKFVDYSYRKKDIKKLRVKDEEDLEYMNSVSSAMLMHTTLSTRLMLWVSALVIIWLIFWAYNAEIDALTRGQGKVIPSTQIQVIQNLEGGIVSEILVQEGEAVKKGDILIKIDDTGFVSNFTESQLRYNELQAKSIRLLAESTGKPFQVGDTIRKNSPELIKYEESLYLSNKEQLENSILIYKHRLEQKKDELREAEARLSNLTKNYELILRELSLNKPLVDKGIVSEVEYLKLQREAGTIEGQMKSTKLSIPRLTSIIDEQKNNILELQFKFRNIAKEKFNEVKAEMSRIESANIAREDKVKRTFVRSPVDGTIKQLLINTVGGVVRPGMNIIEIVPTQDNLLVEAKIRPADIAFLFPGQRAIVKFSAYDFAIYGSLEGTVTHISADTIINDTDKQSYYLVRIKTDKNYLGNEEKKLNVMVGMTADADIITGKKTVLDYILKPILRARENVLSER